MAKERKRDIFKAKKESYEEEWRMNSSSPLWRWMQVVATMHDDDAVICFNFRTDRCREITKALTQEDFPELGWKSCWITPRWRFTIIHFKTQNIFRIDLQTLGEVLSKGLIQIRLPKQYPHVPSFQWRKRKAVWWWIPFYGSVTQGATYDLQPEMSAISEDTLIAKMKGFTPFHLHQFSNSDMVGHTGVMRWRKREPLINVWVATVAKDLGYAILLTADHGNADYMINEDGSPNTAHSMNPVPLFLIDDDPHLKLKTENRRSGAYDSDADGSWNSQRDGRANFGFGLKIFYAHTTYFFNAHFNTCLCNQVRLKLSKPYFDIILFLLIKNRLQAIRWSLWKLLPSMVKRISTRWIDRLEKRFALFRASDINKVSLIGKYTVDTLPGKTAAINPVFRTG